MLSERGNKNNSFSQMEIEPRTVILRLITIISTVSTIIYKKSNYLLGRFKIRSSKFFWVHSVIRGLKLFDMKINRRNPRTLSFKYDYRNARSFKLARLTFQLVILSLLLGRHSAEAQGRDCNVTIVGSIPTPGNDLLFLNIFYSPLWYQGKNPALSSPLNTQCLEIS